MKVVVVYRVLQHWRVPVFSRMARREGIELTVLHGEDFSGTKVINFSGNVDFDVIKLKSIKLKIGTSNGSAYLPFNFGIWRTLRELSPDVIIVEGASNIFNNLVCFVYSKVYNVPLIQWGLGEIEGRTRSLHRRIADIVFRFVERNSGAAIAYSNFGADYYTRIGLPKNRVFTAVNVVDTETRIKELKSYCDYNGLPYPSPLPSRFNVLYVGALAENKGVDILISAFAAFRDATGSGQLTIIGDGPFKESLFAFASQLGVAEHILMPGQITDGIAKYFFEASLFVMPGLGGLAVSDALAHGVPVIATTGDGCEKDLIQNGVNGYYIPNLSVSTLSEILLRLFEDKSELGHLRSGAQDFPKGKFNIQSYVDCVVNAARVVADD